MDKCVDSGHKAIKTLLAMDLLTDEQEELLKEELEGKGVKSASKSRLKDLDTYLDDFLTKCVDDCFPDWTVDGNNLRLYTFGTLTEKVRLE